MTNVLDIKSHPSLDLIKGFSNDFSIYTELRAHTNHSTSLFMRKGDILQNSSSKVGGVSARSFSGGVFGFSSFPGFDANSVSRVIDEAQQNAKLLSTKDVVPLPQSGTGQGIYNYKSTKEEWDVARKIDFLKNLDTYCQKFKLLNVDFMISSLALEKALVTSDGAETYSFIPRCTAYVNMSMDSKDGIVSLHDLMGGLGEIQDKFNSPEDCYPMIDKLYEGLCKKAEGVFPEAGYKDVVLHSNLAGILAHEAIGHTVEADLVLAGSIAGENLGKLVASEKFTLVDGPDRGPDNGANLAIHVDDEGTPCQDTVIIENGVLKSFLHNKESAQKFNVEPTGNARAFSFNDEPLIRMRNTAIKPGTSKLDEMIAEVQDGYYFTETNNGQADTTSEFMFGVISGYEIKNGKLGRAIKDTTISGVAFDMLKTITHVSEDLSWSCGGMCGKKQPMPVGMGGPAIKCKINVGGR